MRASVDSIKAGLRANAILDAYGISYHDAPEIRLSMCPKCGAKSKREAIAINRTTGRWLHHSGSSAADSPCRGGPLELIAALAGLDCERDFPRVLEIAAPIAGVDNTTTAAELDEIQSRRAREQAAYERERAERRAAATAAAPGRWASLARRSPAGEAYLAGRGLDPAELVRLDVVRFDRGGNPAVALHDYDTGVVINVARRLRDPEAASKAAGKVVSKTLVARDCSTDGTLVGKIADLDITGGGPDVAVLVEGIMDSLAAVLAFDGCCVVGANGADRMPCVAAAIAPRIAKARGWLLVVPHVDSKGEDAAAEAVIAAERAGLRLGTSIHLVDVKPHKDLADAVQAGWQWRWS